MRVESTVPDPLARTMTTVYGGGAVIVLGVGFDAFQKQNWPAVAMYVALALLLASQAWSAHSMRGADLTLDDDGLRRVGPWGWNLPWSGVESANVETHKNRPYLVVNRAGKAGSHHSSSWLWGSGFPSTAYVVPLDPARVGKVADALSSRGVAAT